MEDIKLTEDAATWLLRLEDDASTECHAQFKAWLERSPANMEEFLSVTAAYRELDGLDPARSIDVDAYIRESPVWQAAEIVSLPAPARRLAAALTFSARQPKQAAAGGNMLRWAAAAGIATIVACGAAGWWALSTFGNASTYATGVGEQRTLKLDDGSVVQLNTLSRVRVNFSTSLREIRLLDGEALFTVARDTRRPFRVMTATATIQALGTQFNVYQRDGGTLVSVVEGRIQVSTQASPQLPATAPAAQQPAAEIDTPRRAARAADANNILAAGEAAQVNRDGQIVRQASSEVAQTIAWRQRKLDFRGATLAQVAEQFNRYNRRQIRLDGKLAANKELNGVFNADEPQSLVEFLTQDRELKIEQYEEEILIRPAPLPADEELQ